MIVQFFFAGHSARYMFSFDEEEIKRDVAAALKRVGNYEHLLQGMYGEGNQAAVNTLRATFPSADGFKTSSFLVSEYVCSLVLESTKASVIKQAATLSKDNPMHDGWVLQSDFIFHLRWPPQAPMACCEGAAPARRQADADLS